jgi:GTP-binding protein YchF
VANKVDPLSDVETINTELALADMETVDKTVQREGKKAKSGDKEAIALCAVLAKVQKGLDEGKAVRTLGLDDDELNLLKPLCLITVKPVMYIANVDENGFENNPLLEKIVELGKKENAPVVSICAKIEAEISDLEDEDKLLFLSELGLDEPGLDRVIRAAYSLLGLETYFTAGVKEVRAWTVRKGSTAPQAAGVIHTDFERGFIRAEVIGYNDYVQHKGEQGAKEAGKMRLEGKEYIVQDGDVMHFRFNV